MKRILLALFSIVATGAVSAVTLPKADEVRALMEKVADWQIANPSKHPTTDWTQGALFTGMMALDGISASRRFRDAMYETGETNGWKPGAKIYHADDHAVGQMYCEMFERYREPKMIAPLRERFDEILANPDTKPIAGPVSAGKDKTKEMRWWWCDALFMGPPAWTRLYALTGETKYRDFMVQEWKATSAFLYDKEEHLFFRDSTYFAKREANSKKIFWSRGNGWVMGGLARVLQYLPDGDPDRAFFETQFKEMAAAVLKCQQENGLWQPSLLNPADYPVKETSGSGFFAYALAWGINQGLLDRDEYEPAVVKAWGALTGCVDADGRLSHVQPIGSDPKLFDEKSTEVYGVGALLLAGSEVFRMALVSEASGRVEVSAASDLDALRPQLSIEVDWRALITKAPNLNEGNVTILDAVTSRLLDRQLLAVSDGQPSSSLLFQSDFLPKQTRRFLVLGALQQDQQPPPQLRSFGRFVPERYDDFAWENDRTAHRVYGPALMNAPRETGGSGIDVWSKKVRYPIIDKWYKSGAYHKDEGEGCDCYKVGLSRGCGGIGALDGSKITAPMDFVAWRIQANGPIRTTFTLQYPEWIARAPHRVETNAAVVLGSNVTNHQMLAEFENSVAQQLANEAEAMARAPKRSEAKTISLDRGANMNRISSSFTGQTSDGFPFIVGVVKRPGEGELTKDEKAGCWLAYTEPEAAPNGRIHCGLIMPPDWRPFISEVDGHYTIGAMVSPGQIVTYFAGAGWSKGLDFPDHKAWAAYVKAFAASVASPPRVEIK